MKLEFDYKRGQSLFLKHDIEQREYLLSRIIFDFRKELLLELFTPGDEFIEVPESFITTDRNILKATGSPEDEEN
jgi:hypothetical protein